MKRKLKIYSLWFVLSLVFGGVCGLIGTAFSMVLTLVTNARIQNSWLLYLLPLGGMASVAIYRALLIKGKNVLSVFKSAKECETLPHGLPIAIFCGSALSHLFGASVGREGAALQIGGGVANLLGRALRIDESSRKTMILCGMAALFSALFGTPLAAAVFVIEIIATRLCFVSIVPIALSSLVAYNIAIALGVHPERFNIGAIPNFSFHFILKIAVIAIACTAVGFLWCVGLRICKDLTKKLLKNEFLRIAAGGVIIVLLTLILGTRDYNGSGVAVITRVFDGSVKYEAFALKLIFTVICVSSGFKGGEIVPTLFIGATAGGALSVLFDLPMGICAAVGMGVLFATATKCPFATIFLCCEMFGPSGALIIAMAVLLSTVLSHPYKGLYNNKNHLISLIIAKTKPR